MSSQHKKPVLAFIVLVVLAVAVIGLELRASAAGSVSEGPGGTGHTLMRLR